MRPTHIELRSHRAAVWLALLVTVLWSSSWVLIRWGLDDEGLTPVMFAALRYGIAAIVLVAFVIVRERHGRNRYHPDRGFIVRLVTLGVVMYALTQGAMVVALATPVSPSSYAVMEKEARAFAPWAIRPADLANVRVQAVVCTKPAASIPLRPAAAAAASIQVAFSRKV